MALRRKKAPAKDSGAETETGAATPDTPQPEHADGPPTGGGVIKTRVTDLPEGLTQYWRGGQAHSKDWQAWPADTFSEEQLEKIKADPRIEIA